MNGRTNRLLWFLLSTAILGALVYFSEYGEFVDALFGSDLRYVALATACGCFTLLMWAVVWHRFFTLLDIPIRFRESLRLLLAGTFLNSVTPLGRFGGEPFVAHLITRRTEATFPQALSSVSSADLSNAFPFVTFGTVAVLYLVIFGTLRSIVANIVPGVVVFLILSVVTIYLLWFGGIQRLSGAIERLVPFDPDFGRFQPYIESGREKIGETLTRMRDIGDNPREVASTLLFSHVAVLGHVGAVYFTLLAVEVEPVPHTILLVVALSAFLTFSPTPGSMGTFEAGFAGLIAVFFPVTGATAATVAILYRVGTYLPGVVFGYLSLASIRSVK
jgi:uncharacterized protein (TIRG00374 family)